MKDRTSALAQAVSAAPAGSRALAVGYSGGLDSTALLYAIKHHGPSLPLRAIHVCHHLQPEAESWAQQCRARCREWDVDYTRLDVSVDPGRLGLEAAARDARYRAIEDVLAPGEALVTAHHLQDQAETFLLQALRGAGPRGLAGMPTIGRLGARIQWRPWLAVSRAAIRDYATQQALTWIEDPSNQDPAVARSFVRLRVLPEIETRWPAAAVTLARAAAHAHEAGEAVDALAAIDLDSARDPHNRLSCASLAAFSPARGKQVVRRWLAEAGRDTPDHRHLEQILRLPGAALAASPCVHFAHTDVRLFQGQLYGMPVLAPAPGIDSLRWSGAQPLALPNGCGTLSLERKPARTPVLDVTFRRGGERLARAGCGRVRLKDALRDAGVAPWVRERTPLLWCQGELIVVAGLWRHPEIERIVGTDIGSVVWRHCLLDGSARVVRV